MSLVVESSCERMETKDRIIVTFVYRLLGTLLPILNQYCLLAEYIITEFVTTFKITSNLIVSIYGLFIDLTMKVKIRDRRSLRLGGMHQVLTGDCV